jgi:hypothetical protein
MWDMNDIVQVVYVRDHVLRVEFDDGTGGEVDLAAYPERGPIFAPLSDVDFFKMVRIEGGTLSWPNGADIAPERIYERVAGIPSMVNEDNEEDRPTRGTGREKGKVEG